MKAKERKDAVRTSGPLRTEGHEANEGEVVEDSDARGRSGLPMKEVLFRFRM